jgi:hypothetical protein
MEAWIVTGASRGLGRALVDAILDRTDARVVGIARRAPQGIAADRFTFIAADLGCEQDVNGLIGRALAALPATPDTLTLINNAGLVGPIALGGDYPAEEVVRALAVNLQTPILLANDLLRLAPAGVPLRILSISSGAAVSVYPGWGIYGASKAGLDHFSRHLAAEQAGRANGARIVALYPGVVDTDMQADIRASSEEDFPNRARFDALKRDGALTSPTDAACRILRHIDSVDFGTETVVDIRTL